MEIEGEEHQFESTKCSTSAIVTFVLGIIYHNLKNISLVLQLYYYLLSLIGLFAGTFSAIFCKAAYETTVVYDGQTKLFAKPIFMLLLMFASMVPAIFFWLIQQATLKPKDRDTLTYRSMIILIIPCFCDLLCTLLLLVAQLYITASMWQMLRGSIICITAVLKRFVLNHRLRTHMWYGVFIITASMTVVASVPFFTPDTSGKAGTDKDPRIGVVLVILGCFAQGVQYVFEEKVMAVDNVPPLVVIGFEGMWGTLLTLLFVYPLAYAIPGSDVGGVYENPWDAIAMIKSSPFLQVRRYLKFVLIVSTIVDLYAHVYL